MPALASAIVTPMADRTFAKFTFFKIDPAWRRRDAELRAADKREFLAACEDFALDRSLRAYSTIGTRGDVDLVLLSQSPNLDDIHTFHVVLGQSGLAKWAETPYSFLSMTKTLALLRGAGAAGDLRLRAQVPVPLPDGQAAPLVRAAAGGARADHEKPHRGRPPLSRRSRSTPPTPSASTTRSSSSPSRATTRASSSTSSGAAPDRVERVHRAGDADLHLRGDVGRARRSTRSTASPSAVGRGRRRSADARAFPILSRSP